MKRCGRLRHRSETNLSSLHKSRPRTERLKNARGVRQVWDHCSGARSRTNGVGARIHHDEDDQIKKSQFGIEITVEVDNNYDELPFSRMTLELPAGWALELFDATHESWLHDMEHLNDAN